MKNKGSLLFVSTTVVLLIVVLLITCAFNIISFQQNYSESLISSYAVVGRETVRKIEYAVKYGKPLENFYGMQDLLNDILLYSPNIEQAQVVLNNGEIIYDQKGIVTGNVISDEAYEKVKTDIIQGSSPYTYVMSQRDYYIYIPINDKESEVIGSLALSFNQNVLNSVVRTYVLELLKYLFLMVALGILMFLLVSIKKPFLDEGKINKRRYIAVVLIFLGFLQVVYGFLNYLTFRDAYLDVSHQNTETVATIIQKDINSVVSKGIPYNELYDIEDYFKRIIDSIQEIENVHILTNDNQVYSTVGQGSMQGEFADSEYRQEFSLRSDLGGNSGVLYIDISKTNINSMLRTILLDTATVFVISFLFMVEITLFYILLIQRKFKKAVKEEDSASDSWKNITIPLIRYLSFLVFAAGFLSVSFIPVLMNSLYQPFLGLPKSVVLGLPISAEMFFGALAAVWAGHSIDRAGSKPIFLKGVFVFCVGTLLSGLAWGTLSFIIARSATGVGSGLVLMALRTMVVSTPDSLLKNQGIAAMNSGALAGVNCGVMMGAMLVDRVGFSMVFFVALLVMLMTWFVGQRLLDNVLPLSALKKNQEDQIETKRFLFDSKILSFFLLVLIPVSICGMFLHYFFPIFAENMGVSSSNVGRAFLLNGLCIIYLGPVLSKYSEKYLGTEKALVLATLIMGASLVVFAFWGTLVAAFVVVMMLGIADSFGIAAQSNYYLNQRLVSNMGEGKAVSYFSIIGKVGQALGPIAFGTTAVFSMVKGVGVVGGLAIVLVIVFIFIGKGKRVAKIDADHKSV